MALFYSLVPLFIISLISLSSSSSVFDWFKWSSDPIPPPVVHVEDGVPLIPIPFEELSPEEKFLQEAQKYTTMQLSQLDACQHKLIMKIQSSCAGITEEDLAKLSVQLLNCQSEVEDRKLYPCTDKMSLKECTSSMDSDTWNAYHLMNNRARAVCYAARQQQFRALSEMTVNKLMSTAHKQIHSMDQLQEVQNQLGDVATNTLRSMTDGQKDLIEQHSMLRVVQDNIRDAIIHNFNQLKNERALISSGHKELSQMTKELGDKLDSAQKQLQDQSLLSKNNHHQVISDLETIAFRADRIWHRIDDSTKQLLQQQKLTAVRYEETLRNLERINVTVFYLLDLLENTRSELDLRLRWITDIVGGTGEQLDRTVSLLQHIGYLVLGMIVSVFLQTSVLTRLALLCLVTGNVTLMYKFQSSYDALNFTSLTTCIVSIMLGEWIFFSLYNSWLKRSNTVDKYKAVNKFRRPNLFTKCLKWLQNTPRDNNSVENLNLDSNTTSDIKYFNHHLTRHSHRPSSENSYRSESVRSRESESSKDEGFSSNSYEERNEYETLRQRSSSTQPSASPRSFSKSGTPNRAVCQSICRNGQRCRNTVSRDELFCFRHANNSSL